MKWHADAHSYLQGLGQGSRAKIEKTGLKQYKVIFDYGDPVYVLAEDGIDAAYLAMDIASQNNRQLEDVIPYEKEEEVLS